jgi:hypothetical protein
MHGCRRKHLDLAGSHEVVLKRDRNVRCGVRERERSDMGSLRGVTAASLIDLFNLVCFGPDKRNSRLFVHMGGR